MVSEGGALTCGVTTSCAGREPPYQSSACWGKIIFSDKGRLPADLIGEALPPEKTLPLRFKYDVPQDSQVTVQLFNDENMIVRILVAQADRRAGQAVEHWDGLDDSGELLPAGKYVWKGLYHQPDQDQVPVRSP